MLSSFIQDDIAVIPDRLFLTVGTKIEHQYYTGLDTLPSVRVAWTPTSKRTLWAAISNADRNPAATDTSIVSNLGGLTDMNGTPVALRLLGNPKLLDEATISYEAG